MVTVVKDLEELRGYIGKETGKSEWHKITQDQINLFADATGDHQFIHVDPEAAKPLFGSTIAHGYLTLSLLAGDAAAGGIILEGTVRGINYGTNKVRFTGMVPVDSEVRSVSVLKDATEKAGGILLTNEVTMEVKGQDRPAMVAETLSIIYTGSKPGLNPPGFFWEGLMDIITVTDETKGVLNNLDPDVFDEAITPDYLSAYLAQDNHRLMVAVVEGLVVGMVEGVLIHHPDKPISLYIDELGVSEDYHRRGIATALMNALFDWGKDRGAKDYWLGTETDNERAKRFYRSLDPDETEIAYFEDDLLAGEEPPLTLRDRHWFGLGQFAEGVKNEGFSLFLLFYYTQVLGLSGSLAGLAILIALLFDAVTDPLAGALSDRTKGKWGRRHPWLFAAAIPTAVFFWFTFNPPAGLEQSQLFVWMLCFVVLTRGGMTLFHVPHLSLGAELSDDYEVRTNIVRIRNMYSRIGGGIGAMVGLLIFMRPTDDFPNGQLNPEAYPGYATVAAILIAITVIASAWFTRNRIPYLHQINHGDHRHNALAAAFIGIWEGMKSRSFRALFGGNVLSFIAWGTTGALGLHLGTYFWRASTTDLFIWGFFAAIGVFVGLFYWEGFSRRHDKRTTFIRGLIVFLIFTAPPPCLKLLGFWPPIDHWSYLPAFWLLVGFCAHVGVAALMVTGGAMMADVIDEDEHKHGERREGVFFGATSFIAKAASGVGSLIAGLVIDFVGLTPDMTPENVPFHVEQGLGYTLAFVIVVLVGASGAVFSRYDISREKLAAIQSDLKARNDTSIQKNSGVAPAE
ncbi:htdZ [Symbiodinium microadriaticum]|nr:htdZ [Symbiodinium microadriaticum]